MALSYVNRPYCDRVSLGILNSVQKSELQIIICSIHISNFNNSQLLPTCTRLFNLGSEVISVSTTKTINLAAAATLPVIQPNRHCSCLLIASPSFSSHAAQLDSHNMFLQLLYLYNNPDHALQYTEVQQSTDSKHQLLEIYNSLSAYNGFLHKQQLNLYNHMVTIPSVRKRLTCVLY